jgi:hypothetical protein
MNKYLPVLITLLTFGSFGVVGDDVFIQLSCKSIGMENIEYINKSLNNGNLDKKNWEDFDYELCKVNNFSVNRIFTFNKQFLRETKGEAEYSLLSLCGAREEYIPLVKMDITTTKILFHIEPEGLGPLIVDRKSLETPKWGASRYSCVLSELEENKL